MTAPELALTLPLRGVQLIEASAGTGKTHTLATLYARLVIEARLEVSQILAVTYTRAATAELRERLRLRLQQAAQRAGQMVAGDDPGSDDGIGRLLGAALAREPGALLIARLRRAVAAMDVAPVHTIHAFCQRALADYALEAGQSLLPRQLLANERELQLEVATEFWRETSRDAAGARALAALASSPLALSRTLRELVACDALEPASPGVLDEDAELALAGACERLAADAALHGDDARAQLREAARTGAINRQRSADDKVDRVWAALEEWREARDHEALSRTNLAWFGSTELRGKWNGKHGPLPQSPLFDTVERWQQASAACAQQRQRERLALLHRLKTFAGARLSQLKLERGLVGYDDLVRQVADALASPRGSAFAARLQSQYRVALVDEFQDTDRRQSAIFERLFATAADAADAAAVPTAARALFLIGDPKQAIYRFRGGDVHAYLLAAHRAERHALQHNFRSRPLALAALQALYDHAGDDAFAHEGIRFQPVQPGGLREDGDFLVDGEVAPALTVLELTGVESATPIQQARQAAAQAAAGAILELLQAGSEGRARRRGPDGRCGAVRAGDIAVLVEQHEDGALMRAALDALGIPATVSGRDNVLLTPQAEDLRRLLQALRAPSDEGLLRAALATGLLGFDALALEALAGDEQQQRDWQQRMQDWRQRIERHGPLALLGTLVAAQAPRLLSRPGGERALANLLQLGEALQDVAHAAPGIDALLDAFERRIELADRDNEDELLRLESDAERVAILTLHASKGLEFEFVFLPFIATHGSTRAPKPTELVRHHDGERHLLYLPGIEPTQDEALRAIECAEERAEGLRLLYVGLTRARLATWIAWGPAKKFGDTALAWLLHRRGQAGPGERDIDIERDLGQWQQRAPLAIARRDAPVAPIGARHVATPADPAPVARVAQRTLGRDWWVYSYSMLAREARGESEAVVDELGADDEIGAIDVVDSTPGEYARLAGPRFGNSLHAALERADFARWRDWTAEEPPPGEALIIDAALRAEGYGSDADLVPGRALLTRLIAATLNVRLPEGLRLCELAPDARRDELEFHISLAPTAIPALLARLHAHGVARDRTMFGLRRRIEGLLTGRIDLVYFHGGRYFLLDYKSNRLPDYRPAALEAAVRDSEYDLQYVLYALALHRWLRFRLGTGYDYARDFGGVRYLFCRGLQPQSPHGEGIHALRPPRALIESLDELFAAGAGDLR